MNKKKALESYEKALAYAAKGNLSNAEKAYRKAIASYPDFLEAHNNLGNLLAKQGRLLLAYESISKAHKLLPTNARITNNLGHLSQSLGDIAKALDLYRSAIESDPEYAPTYINLGNALREVGDYQGALDAYDKALELDDKQYQLLVNKGALLNELHKFSDAKQALDKAIQINSKDAHAHNNLGNTFVEINQPDNAIQSFRQSLSLSPNNPDVLLNLANTHLGTGDTEAAKLNFEKVLALDPTSAEAHYGINRLKKYLSVDDPQIKKMLQIKHSKITREDDKSLICFALSKTYEDLGKLEEAFRFLKEGNELKKKILKYERCQDQKEFDKLEKAARAITRIKLPDSELGTSKRPIFIVGMPRSGTTLVESILSQHPRVMPAGELHYIQDLGNAILMGDEAPSENSIKEFRRSYLRAIEAHELGQDFFTDKSPLNFKFIPLILTALPDSLIVHTKRDAKATCWSNFKQFFTSHNLGFCYDLDDVTNYYLSYLKLMRSWNEMFPGRIIDVEYESLTTNPSEEIRALVRALSIEWHDDLLAPHLSSRFVRTASVTQVRDKIYRGSSEAWKKYESFLVGAFDSLQKSIE